MGRTRDQLRATAVTASERRPRIVAVLPGLYPSTIIGLAKPLLRLHAARDIDLDLTFQFLVRPQQLDHADVLVLCHSLDPDCEWMLDQAARQHLPIVYEMDDNLLEPPPDNAGMAFLKTPERQALLRRCLAQSVLVRVYAPALREVLEPLTAHIALVPGPIDWALVPDRPTRDDSGVVRMVYATGRQQDAIGTMLVAPVRHVIDAHPHVQLTVWGPRLPGLSDHPRIQHRERIADYDRFFAEFARSGFDIGLAPLPDDPFHRCKTNLKFREYAACRIAGVYSDTEVYQRSVTDGVTGLLVPNDEGAWVAALTRLTGDSALRNGIEQRAFEYASAHYPPGKMEEDWLAHLREVAERAATQRLATPQPNVTAASALPSPGVAAMGAGIVREALRYASRVPALVQSRGPKEVWHRARGQVAHFRQLIAWEFALRRLQRQHQRR